MRSSQDPESFTQQRSPDPLPARGPMHKRHGASQLEVRDRLIEAHALGGILLGARLVRSLEAVGERIEPSQRTKMAQTQKPKMSRKMGHVEQGVILAKFVEVQTGELITMNDEMLWRKVTMGRTRRPAGQRQAALLDPAQKIAQTVFGFWKHFGQKLSPNMQRV